MMMDMILTRMQGIDSKELLRKKQSNGQTFYVYGIVRGSGYVFLKSYRLLYLMLLLKFL